MAHTYSATIVRWVDGDTVDVTVELPVKADLDFYVQFSTTYVFPIQLRLNGIDTPEHKAGAAATARVKQLAPPGTRVTITSYKSREKYGRFLADVFVGDLSINQTLLDEKLAVPYDGGTKGS